MVGFLVDLLKVKQEPKELRVTQERLEHLELQEQVELQELMDLQDLVEHLGLMV